MSVSREYLARCAAASGYAESSLEKVIRLGELAGDVARHGPPILLRSAITPLEPVEARTMWQPGELDRPQVRTVGLTELLVGKMVALLARSAPRDLWDIVNLPAEALNRLRTPVYRSWFVGIASGASVRGSHCRWRCARGHAVSKRSPSESSA